MVTLTLGFTLTSTVIAVIAKSPGMGPARAAPIARTSDGDNATLTPCRCTSDACLAAVPFDDLNVSTHGRLVSVPDEYAPCIWDGVNSSACAADLHQSDDEFFYTGQVGGFMHTGLYDAGRPGEGGWNISHKLAAAAVAAEEPEDVQAAVRFAVEHNLRLAVKNTGHDWYGRSGSHPSYTGSLLVWTHRMKAITWEEAPLVPHLCTPADAVNATVTLGAGVQFADLYPVAEARGRFVNGGTCTSVGMAGCAIGGCFGTFSQALGPAASNLVQAKVVLANGSLVTASACSHPRLFWAIRGGGAGFGILVELTMRTYDTPAYITSVRYEGTVGSRGEAAVHAAAMEVLRAADRVAAAHQGWNGGLGIPTVTNPYFSVSLTTYNGNGTAGVALLAPLAAWAEAQPPADKISGKVSTSVEHRPASGWAVPGAPEGQVRLPWDDPHHDSEIGTEHLVSMSKWVTRTALHEGPGDTGLRKIATALVNLSTIAQSGLLAALPSRVSLGMYKVQGGATPHAAELFRGTAQNPVLLDTVSFLTSQWRVPTLPELPPSAAVLKALWPRLQTYAITSKADPLRPRCEAGAAGDEAAAVACLQGWTARVPAIVAELNALKDELFRQFPPSRGGIPHWSGSYWNEADYYEPMWQESFWGNETYTKLLAVKQQYDPRGLFVCHHCVGSETWDSTGNCRV